MRFSCVFEIIIVINFQMVVCGLASFSVNQLMLSPIQMHRLSQKYCIRCYPPDSRNATLVIVVMLQRVPNHSTGLGMLRFQVLGMPNDSLDTGKLIEVLQ